MIAQTFVTQYITVVINARSHHTAAQGDVLHRLKLGHRGVDPVSHWLAVNSAAVNRRTTTPMCGLLHQQNLFARRRRSFCGLQTGNPATDNNNIGKEIEVFVGVGVFQFFVRRFTQTGRLTHEGFVDVLPEAARMNEHLVIEARRQEAREVGVDCAHVEFQRRPVVLRGDFETIKQLGRGGALVGFEFRPLAHVE